GFFLSPTLAVGAVFGLATILNDGDNNVSSSSLLLRPYLRYFLSSAKASPWFLQASFAYTSTQTGLSNDFDLNTQSTSLAFDLGKSIFLGTNLAFEPFVRFTQFFDSNFEIDGNGGIIPEFIFGEDGRTQLAFGIEFQYYLRRKTN
ncbi:MAG: hypothetical protein AAF242_10740, partial [Bacteroidota bacterium]